jgi:hypothetical protein
LKHKDIRQASYLRGQQHYADQQQMEGQQLDRNVVGHVEHEDLRHARHADQGPSVAVRGKNRSSPPSTSTEPSIISYGWELRDHRCRRQQVDPSC